jgi:hypothetical protein
MRNVIVLSSALNAFRKALFLLAVLFCTFSNCFSQELIAQINHPESFKKISFTDIFIFPIGPKGGEYSLKALALRGQFVSIQGFMVRSDVLHKGEFFLAPTPLELNEDDDGPADDLPINTILVQLDKSQENLLLPHHDGILQITGKLELGRHESSSGKVSWVRVVLLPEFVNISGIDVSKLEK